MFKISENSEKMIPLPPHGSDKSDVPLGRSWLHLLALALETLATGSCFRGCYTPS